MTLDLAGPVTEQPGRARAPRSASKSRCAPPGRPLGATRAIRLWEDGWGEFWEMTRVVLLSRRRVYCSSARGKQVAALATASTQQAVRSGFGECET